MIIKYVDTPKLKVKRNFSSPVASTGEEENGSGKKKRKKPIKDSLLEPLNTPEAEPDWFGKGGGNL